VARGNKSKIKSCLISEMVTTFLIFVLICAKTFSIFVRNHDKTFGKFVRRAYSDTIKVKKYEIDFLYNVLKYDVALEGVEVPCLLGNLYDFCYL